jgi:hypothetical protein
MDNLGVHRQVWMLTLDLLGVSVMGEAVEGNLHDCGTRAFEIRHTVSAQFDMRVGNGRHLVLLGNPSL